MDVPSCEIIGAVVQWRLIIHVPVFWPMPRVLFVLIFVLLLRLLSCGLNCEAGLTWLTVAGVLIESQWQITEYNSAFKYPKANSIANGRFYFLIFSRYYFILSLIVYIFDLMLWNSVCVCVLLNTTDP